jgi:hypothetical protein
VQINVRNNRMAIMNGRTKQKAQQRIRK